MGTSVVAETAPRPAPDGGSRPGAERASRRRPALATTLAALVAVPLTLAVLPPPLFADAYAVWRAAQLWPDIEGSYPPNIYHHAMRLGTVLPTRLAQELFGSGQTAFVVTSIALLALFTAGSYALGRALFRPWVGLATLALFALHPYFTRVDAYDGAVSVGTGEILPDAPSAGLFCLGVAALAVAARRAGRAQVRWLAAAGLCWGVAYLVREYVAFLYVAIPIFFWLLRVPLRRLVVPAVPMLAVLGFELAHNWMVWGDPLARLTVAGEHGGPIADPLRPIRVLTAFLRATDNHALGRVFVVALIVTVVGALVFRDRRLWLIVAWFASLWVPLTLLGGLLDPGEPTIRPQLSRYWYVVLPALVAGALWTGKLAVDRIRAGRNRRIVGVGLAVVLGLAHLVPAVVSLTHVRRDADWRDLRAYLRAHPEVEVIYTDSRAVETATFYAREPDGTLIWDGRFVAFRQLRPTAPLEQIGTDPMLHTRAFGVRRTPTGADGLREVWRSRNGLLSLWQTG